MIKKRKINKNNKRPEHVARLRKIRNATPKDTKVLRELPLLQKSEMILQWHIDGGIVDNKRMSRMDLAKLFDMNNTEIDAIIEKTQRSLIKVLDTKESMRENVMLVASTLLQQMRVDRGRSVIYANSVDRIVGKIEKDLEKAYSLPETTQQEINVKKLEIGSQLTRFRQFCYHRTECSRLLNETTQSMQRFLELFSGGKDRDLSKLTEPLQPENPENPTEAPVTYTDAIKLLEQHTAPIIPSQEFELGVQRNPSSGFEELEQTSKENLNSNGTA